MSENSFIPANQKKAYRNLMQSHPSQDSLDDPSLYQDQHTKSLEPQELDQEESDPEESDKEESDPIHSAEEEESDKKIMEKHSIAFWLMEDSLLPSSEDTDDKAQTYIRTLKLCSANFAVMYDNMEAGLMYGKTITGLDDADEISRLSDEYKNHAYYIDFGNQPKPQLHYFT